MLVREGAGNGEATGTAAVRIQRLNNPSPCPAIAFDPTGKTGAIDQDAEIDCFAPRRRRRRPALPGPGGRDLGRRHASVRGRAPRRDHRLRADRRRRGLLPARRRRHQPDLRLRQRRPADRQLPDRARALPQPRPGARRRPSAPPRWRRSTTRARSRCYTFTGASGDRIRSRVIPTSRRAQPGDRGPAPRRHHGLREHLRRRSDLRPGRQRHPHGARPRGRRQRRGDSGPPRCASSASTTPRPVRRSPSTRPA